ncbi:hypothetical protein M0R45_010510 [Rubus argutus]|uniref:SKP1-like protein n=1 Tax=Rubus argutus TaxID=59490 RepID=A0AAW1Y886_RUBAR
MSMTDEKKMITLRCSDGEQYVVEEEVAVESQTIKDMVEVDCASNVIPLSDVTGKVLAKVLEYCKKRTEEDEVALVAWDKDYVDNLDTNTLYDVILAANYLNIKGLLDLTCQKVADMIRGKQSKEIREIFNIKNDLTREEEEEVRRENSWSFD